MDYRWKEKELGRKRRKEEKEWRRS